MTVVDVVDVVTVVDGLVAASRAVLMGVVGVLDAATVAVALIPVTVVLMVTVPVVDIVDVVAVDHARMAAAWTVLVVVAGVRAVVEIGRHAWFLSWCAGAQSSSAAWISASSTMWRTCWSRSE